MKLSKTVKEGIARKAVAAMIAKKRDAAYETLRKELTAIAERQFADVPVKDMKKYGEYIEFTNHLKGGKGYPDGFIDVEKRHRKQYEDFGFVPSDDIPLLKQFPCKVLEYNIKVSDEYAEDYVRAVMKIKIAYESGTRLPKELDNLLAAGKKNMLTHSMEPDKTIVLFDAMRKLVICWFVENGKEQK
jgi:hypothetical protein